MTPLDTIRQLMDTNVATTTNLRNDIRAAQLIAMEHDPDSVELLDVLHKASSDLIKWIEDWVELDSQKDEI